MGRTPADRPSGNIMPESGCDVEAARGASPRPRLTAPANRGIVSLNVHTQEGNDETEANDLLW